MHLLLAIFGGFIVIFIYVDAFWTAMGEGGGPFSKRVMSGLWKLLLTTRHRYGAKKLFSFAGVIITMVAVALWILILWVGWSLIFSGGEQAVLHAQTRAPADFWERVYFTGFTIFTLGVGDYVPHGALWEILTTVAAWSGLFLVTFSITYLVPVTQAATQKRQVAVYIFSIGRTPEEIIQNTWSDGNCQALAEHLPSLTSELVKLKQNHLTYPVLHYFHSSDTTEAAALAVAALDEALTIVEHGINGGGGYCMKPGVYRPARQAINAFLDTLATAFIEPEDEIPPLPTLSSLREENIPTVSDAVFRARMRELSERRRLLLALVRNDGWTWDQLKPGNEREASTLAAVGA